MNLNLFLTAFTPLLFSMSWKISSDVQQDLFILNGVNNGSAYFFRRDETFYLYLGREQHMTVLQYNLSCDHLTFSWPDFTINNISMSDQNLTNYRVMELSSFTFINPDTELIPCTETSLVQPTYVMPGVKYGYIVLICAVTLLLNKITGGAFIKTIVNRLKTVQSGSEYEMTS